MKKSNGFSCQLLFCRFSLFDTMHSAINRVQPVPGWPFPSSILPNQRLLDTRCVSKWAAVCAQQLHFSYILFLSVLSFQFCLKAHCCFLLFFFWLICASWFSPFGKHCQANKNSESRSTLLRKRVWRQF